MPDTFATALTCIDGRVHPRLVPWMRELYSVSYVDLVTEPGPERFITRDPERALAVLKPKVAISVTRHASRVLVVAGHYDCAANPVADEEHREQLRAAVPILLGWDLGVQVVGVWVNADWQPEIVKARSSPT